MQDRAAQANGANNLFPYPSPDARFWPNQFSPLQDYCWPLPATPHPLGIWDIWLAGTFQAQ